MAGARASNQSGGVFGLILFLFFCAARKVKRAENREPPSAKPITFRRTAPSGRGRRWACCGSCRAGAVPATPCAAAPNRGPHWSPWRHPSSLPKTNETRSQSGILPLKNDYQSESQTKLVSQISNTVSSFKYKLIPKSELRVKTWTN